MKITGGCYCKKIRYEAEGDPITSFQCHCRECQYYTGGGANYAIAMPRSGFTYTAGEATKYSRKDLEVPVSRDFCDQCGTAIASYYEADSTIIMLKVGSFDDPSVFTPDMAAYTCDKQSFHHIPDGLPAFETTPDQ